MSMMFGGGAAACAKTRAGAAPRPSAAMPPARNVRRFGPRAGNSGGQQTQLRENPGLIMRFPSSPRPGLAGAQTRQQRGRVATTDHGEIANAESEILQPLG